MVNTKLGNLVVREFEGHDYPGIHLYIERDGKLCLLAIVEQEDEEHLISCAYDTVQDEPVHMKLISDKELEDYFHEQKD